MEETSEGVGILGGKDVEQGHTAVQPSQCTLTAKEFPTAKQLSRFFNLSTGAGCVYIMLIPIRFIHYL